MECKLEVRAFRYGEGTLDPQEAADFEKHISLCPNCQLAARQSREMDALLASALAPDEAPPNLSERILAQLPSTTIEEAGVNRPASPPRFTWLRPQFIAAGLALAIIAAVGVFSSPSAVVAWLREAMYFVPGIGITAFDESSVANARSVSSEVNGYILTVTTLISGREGTNLKFEITGLPGGKEPWIEQTEARDNLDRGQLPKPYLQDASGKTYDMASYMHGVGGSPEASEISGEMNFARLQAGTTAVTLIVPTASILPRTLAKDGSEWRVNIPLVAIDQAHFAAARELDVVDEREGIETRLTAVSFTPEETALSIVASATGEDEFPIYIGRQMTPEELYPKLTDEQGRSYHNMPVDAMRAESRTLEVPLVFDAVPRDVKTLHLKIPVISVKQSGEATLRVDLTGHKVGETWPLDSEIKLGTQTLRLLSAKLQQSESGPTKLKIDVDLGPRQRNRQLIGFAASMENRHGFWETHYDHETGQFDYIVIPVEPDDADEVTFNIENPVVAIYGNWSLEFAPREQ